MVVNQQRRRNKTDWSAITVFLYRRTKLGEAEKQKFRENWVLSLDTQHLNTLTLEPFNSSTLEPLCQYLISLFVVTFPPLLTVFTPAQGAVEVNNVGHQHIPPTLASPVIWQCFLTEISYIWEKIIFQIANFPLDQQCQILTRNLYLCCCCKFE